MAGVNLMLAPDITVNFCQGRMLSPDGRCKTFDASADGYVRGEGCGVAGPRSGWPMRWPTATACGR